MTIVTFVGATAAVRGKRGMALTATLPTHRAVGRWSPVALFLVATATFVAVFHAYFNSAWVPLSDNASNAMLVLDAKRFALLHGNYSRVGFYHPGPHLFYLMAAGEILFHDLLGIARSMQAAQLLAVLCLSIVILQIVERVYRDLAAGDVLISVCATAATALCVVLVVPETFTSIWVPHTYVTSALLFFVGGAALVAGRFKWLWVFVLGGAMLTAGHASFLGLVPIMGVVFLAAVIALHPQTRALAGLRALIATHRTSVVASIIILAILILPIALNVLLHFPGELGKYIAFSTKQPKKDWGDVARVVLPHWKSAGVALGVLAGALLASPSDTSSAHRRRHIATAALAVFLAGTGAVLFYLQKGVDVIADHTLYVVWWYQAAPATCVGLAVICAGMTTTRRLPFAAILLLLVAAGIWFTHWPSPPMDDSANVERTMTLLQQKSRERGTPVRLALDVKPSLYTDTWARAVGLIAEQERRGGQIACVEDYSWHISYHARNRCAPASPNEVQTRFVASYDDLTPIGGVRVAWFVGLQLFEFDPVNWPSDRVGGPWVGLREFPASAPRGGTDDPGRATR